MNINLLQTLQKNRQLAGKLPPPKVLEMGPDIFIARKLPPGTLFELEFLRLLHKTKEDVRGGGNWETPTLFELEFIRFEEKK